MKLNKLRLKFLRTNLSLLEKEIKSGEISYKPNFEGELREANTFSMEGTRGGRNGGKISSFLC